MMIANNTADRPTTSAAAASGSVKREITNSTASTGRRCTAARHVERRHRNQRAIIAGQKSSDR
jgi:hypothetical protein